jgi:hypothetical protein
MHTTATPATPAPRKAHIRPWRTVVEGWRLTRDQYPLLLAIVVLGLAVSSVVPFGILAGPMMCGIHLAFLRKIDGERASLDILFEGFEYFIASLAATLVIMMIQIAVVLLFLAGAVVMTLSLLRATGEDFATLLPTLLILWFCIYVLALLVAINVYFFFMFAYILIPDKNLRGIAALGLSLRAVVANLGGVVGVAMLASLPAAAVWFAAFSLTWVLYRDNPLVLVLATALLSALTVFALPPIFGAITIAYRRIFPAEPQTPSESPHGTVAAH